MNQEQKKVIHSLLKEVIPKSWKWSLAVQDHSTIILNIREADIDLIALCHQFFYDIFFIRLTCVMAEGVGNTKPIKKPCYTVGSSEVHRYFIGEHKDLFERINKALNHGNYDRSDRMSDYINVGFYSEIRIGRWDKPFIYNPSKTAKAA